MNVSFINPRGLVLKGLLDIYDYSKIILLIHGYTGDKTEHGIFDITANEMLSNGFSVFRFDFGGCGESDNSTLKINFMIEDLNSSIKYVKEKGFKKIGLLGYSLGGFLSIKSLNENIKSLVLWSPLISPINLKNNYPQKEIEYLEKYDNLVVHKNNGKRKNLVINKSLFDDINNIKQKELLNLIKIPTLILHGKNDTSISYKNSKKAKEFLLKESKVKIIKNEDHSITNKIDIFTTESIKWFERYL
jgi:alpha-beta hydrolase superfamily lysophospholipase